MKMQNNELEQKAKYEAEKNYPVLHLAKNAGINSRRNQSAFANGYIAGHRSRDAEVEELVKILNPFYDLANEILNTSTNGKEGTVYSFNWAEITYKDLRNVVTALMKYNTLTPETLLQEILQNIQGDTIIGLGIKTAVKNNTPAIEIIKWLKSQASDNKTVMAEIIGEQMTDKLINF